MNQREGTKKSIIAIAHCQIESLSAKYPPRTPVSCVLTNIRWQRAAALVSQSPGESLAASFPLSPLSPPAHSVHQTLAPLAQGAGGADNAGTPCDVLGNCLALDTGRPKVLCASTVLQRVQRTARWSGDAVDSCPPSCALLAVRHTPPQPLS